MIAQLLAQLLHIMVAQLRTSISTTAHHTHCIYYVYNRARPVGPRARNGRIANDRSRSTGARSALRGVWFGSNRDRRLGEHPRSIDLPVLLPRLWGGADAVRWPGQGERVHPRNWPCSNECEDADAREDSCGQNRPIAGRAHEALRGLREDRRHRASSLGAQLSVRRRVRGMAPIAAVPGASPSLASVGHAKHGSDQRLAAGIPLPPAAREER